MKPILTCTDNDDKPTIQAPCKYKRNSDGTAMEQHSRSSAVKHRRFPLWGRQTVVSRGAAARWLQPGYDRLWLRLCLVVSGCVLTLPIISKHEDRISTIINPSFLGGLWFLQLCLEWLVYVAHLMDGVRPPITMHQCERVLSISAPVWFWAASSKNSTFPIRTRNCEK